MAFFRLPVDDTALNSLSWEKRCIVLLTTFYNKDRINILVDKVIGVYQ